jgi:hypothetical protein
VKKSNDVRGQGLSGNSMDRRAEFRKLQKQYGKEQVKRIDNLKSAIRNTRVEVNPLPKAQ